MWITDDDQNMVFRVDPANPTSVISQFSVGSSSTNDPEDIAVDPSNGHLFIVNGVQRTIVERTNTGAIVTTINLPTVIEDPEALAYDAVHDAFYVSGGFTYKIWRVNRQGQIEGTLEVLNGYSNPAPGGPGSVHVKDMEFAPSSNPNDDPAKLSLYVADYGNSHVDDGRLFEIDLGTFWV
jgi:DNA-binding beta-propeller fold protein YncE